MIGVGLVGGRGDGKGSRSGIDRVVGGRGRVVGW